MTAATHPTRLRGRAQRRSGNAGFGPHSPKPDTAPVVVAVDNSPASEAATRDAVRLARQVRAPVVFVYVRRGPSLTFGRPYYQRRLDGAMAAGRSALAGALAVAEQARVPATGELLEGHPARRVVEFARLRDARLVVLGSRRRLLGSSVSRRVIRAADRPVLVSGRTAPAAG